MMVFRSLTFSTAGWAAAMELGPLGMAPWGDIETSLAVSDPTPDINILCRLLAKMGVRPDFGVQGKTSADSLRYIHKTIDGADVYFVANKNAEAVEAVCSFRVQGRRPELWSPDSGRIERTAVLIHLVDATQEDVAQEIDKLAREYAQTRPAAIRLNYGLQRHYGGGMAARTIACLPAVVGAWRDFGGGVLLSTSAGFPRWGPAA